MGNLFVPNGTSSVSILDVMGACRRVGMRTSAEQLAERIPRSIPIAAEMPTQEKRP